MGGRATFPLPRQQLPPFFCYLRGTGFPLLATLRSRFRGGDTKAPQSTPAEGLIDTNTNIMTGLDIFVWEKHDERLLYIVFHKEYYLYD